MEVMNFKSVLYEMIDKKKTLDLENNMLHPTGMISRIQADFITSLIEDRNLAKCGESGVAYGASTVAICGGLNALEKRGIKCKHYGVDPFQYSQFNGAAIAALRRCGLEYFFELLDGPSHLMLPKLIERGEKLDMFFVDGWHTFDYSIIDVFFADKLLRPGGILLLHDFVMPSKRKVWGYLCSHRRYRPIQVPMRTTVRRILSCGKSLIGLDPRMGFANLTKPLLFGAEKLEDFEPTYDFFHNF